MQYETTFDRKTGLFDTRRVDFNSLVNDFARGQALAIRLSQAGGSVRDDHAELPDSQSCATCGADLEKGWILSDTGKRLCFRCEESEREAAIEAARCTFCGADDCRKHTGAELLARGGGDL